MKLLFEPRSPHLKIAHEIFKEHLEQGDHAFDATLGNGYDTAFIAPLVLPTGKVIACDLQEEAITKSKTLLGDLSENITWSHCSHAVAPLAIPDYSLSLAVYNLGYLPGGNKALITETASTIESLSLIVKKMKPGGLVSITTYSAHEGGEEEEKAVERFTSSLSKESFRVATLSWPNRTKSPKLFLIQVGSTDRLSSF